MKDKKKGEIIINSDASGCGCVLIILGLLGFSLFGAPSTALVVIGILILIFA